VNTFFASAIAVIAGRAKPVRSIVMSVFFLTADLIYIYMH